MRRLPAPSPAAAPTARRTSSRKALNAGKAAASILAAACFLSGCAATLPTPTSTEHGILVVRAETRGAVFPGFVKLADSATIEALDDKGRPLDQLHTFRSDKGERGYVYFVNLPAGRYALVSASFKARGARYFVKTNEEEARKAAVRLAPGKAAYLGTHRFDSAWPEPWTGVARALRIVLHWLTPWTRRPLLPREGPYRGAEFGLPHEAPAMLAARSATAGTPWRRLIEERVLAAGVAEPPPTRGLVRVKELPLKEEKDLAWRDCLGWGEPRRREGAYEWRSPDGEARAAVFFTTASAPGFAGFDAAKRELGAKASVEDTGRLFEVRVSTRIGIVGRATSYHYPQGDLVGSRVIVIVTETVLIPDAYGLWTARLRAPREEFEKVLPAFREFLTQLQLGAPKKKDAAKSEPTLPILVTP